MVEDADVDGVDDRVVIGVVVLVVVVRGVICFCGVVTKHTQYIQKKAEVQIEFEKKKEKERQK